MDMTTRAARISIEELRMGPCRPVVIHSTEGALYTASVVDDGAERALTDSYGRALSWRSLQRAREALQEFPVASLTLRQRSAYDEMVGQPRGGSNVLEVPLSIVPESPLAAR